MTKESDKRRAVYKKMRLTDEQIMRVERFASAGATKTERNMRAGWYVGRYMKAER